MHFSHFTFGAVFTVFFTSGLLVEICSFPHPSFPFEEQHNQAISKLNLTKQQFADLELNFSFQLSAPVNAFTRNFIRALSEKRENDNKNIIVSPFSIHAALSMLFFGSPKNTTTNNELSRVLGLSTKEGKGSNYLFNYLYLLKFYNNARRLYDTEVELANKIFIQDGFVPKDYFKTLLEAFYLTSTENVNFLQPGDAVYTINQYVSGKTRGLIQEIIASKDVGILTRLVLVNAIYFRANWKYQFNKKFTAPMLYNLFDKQGSIQHEKGMQVEAAFRSSSSERLNARILELPYESPDFNMYILIPKNNSLESLNQLVTELSFEEIQKTLKNSSEIQMKVYMPAFESTYETGLKETLNGIGVNSLFTDADLGDISDEALYVSDALHKAQVNVNEEGSEAAASTAVIVNTRSGGIFRTIPEFRVDQPFVFLIHDSLNNIPLFIGRIINPTGKTISRQTEGTIVQNTNASQSAGFLEQKHINDKFVENVDEEYYENEDSYGDKNNKTIEIRKGSGDADCEEGEQHHISEHEEGVTFPCIGRDTEVIEKAESLKIIADSEKFKTVEKLIDSRKE